jgi:CubicO group peptidase (beta-lactamase class C family)
VTLRQSSEPAFPASAPREAWDRPPFNRWAFQHVRELLPTAVISRGDAAPRILPRNERRFDHVAATGITGETVTLGGFLEETYTDGFLVLKHGAIVCEQYFNGMDERSLHLSQSVAKSFCGALAGILAGRGVLDIATPVTQYVPELEATAYAGATIAQLLDMTSGVRFSEDYEDPLSDMGRADVASGWKPMPKGGDPAQFPRTMFDLVLSLKQREREHGAAFSYRSIETDVLAMAMERASGKRLAQLMSEELWQKIGMEADGCITVDASGFALADGGLNACLRDYGRFGQMMLENGAGIVPREWVEATRRGNHTIFGEPYTVVLPQGAYSRQFWVEDRSGAAIMARGVFGQLIYISFEHDLVAVKLSSWPHFVNPGWTRATLDAVHAIAAEVA